MICGLTGWCRPSRNFDPMFDPQTETAWRRALQPGIEFMKSRY